MNITKLRQWIELKSIADSLCADQRTKRPQRHEQIKLSLSEGLHVWIDKKFDDKKILTLLIEIGNQVRLKKKFISLFQGDEVNPTEHQKALHPQLRNTTARDFYKASPMHQEQIKQNLEQMELISDSIRSGSWIGYTGKPIRRIVNIGIGGSYSGSMLLHDALKFYRTSDIDIQFLSNIDPWDIQDTIDINNLEETLFIISSKSFETKETLTNTKIVISLYKNNPKAIAQHFIVITNKPEKAQRLGFYEDQIIKIPDSIGGRYSIWSAMSLAAVIGIGMEFFKQFLSGGHLVDYHVMTCSPERNIPILLGLIDVWNINFLGTESIAIIPYAKRLRHIIPYISQLYMESLGKNYTVQGNRVPYQTGAVIWGDTGTNSQHSFHQLLMQGTRKIHCDFILPLKTNAAHKELHDDLKLNCYAQIQALQTGTNDNNPYYAVSGDKSYTLLELDNITPNLLGQLVALYEHRVYTQAVVWDINPFDQFGVELAKVLCEQVRL